VYRSIDGGENWNTFNRGLPSGSTELDTNRWRIEKSVARVIDPITRLVIDPIQSNILYVGTGSGVFKSTDYGANWQGVNAGLPRSYIRALAINPKNPNIIYASTIGTGIFKSIDGGENWTLSSNGIFCGPRVGIM
jgi:photosystem II stability/assembly factor-like uncharacterized protein